MDQAVGRSAGQGIVNELQRITIAICVVLGCLFCRVQAVNAERPSLPRADTTSFVAGFERFGRHSEIEATIAGDLLLTELSCTACHASPNAELAPKQGPNLDGVGSRVHHDWLQRYLLAPKKAKPGTTMPDALAGLPADERQFAANAIATFLASQTQAFPEIKATGANPVPFEFWERGDIERGRTLYHQIGCVACHDADDNYEVAEMKPSPIDKMLRQLDPEEIAEMGLASMSRRVESVPHGDLARKYSPQSLTHFLLKPSAVRPAGRMPDFQLKAVDAADIAAWLISREAKNVTADALSEFTPDDSLVEQGRKLFSQVGCANCHALKGVSKTVTGKPLMQLNSASTDACFLSTPRQAGQPQFSLDDQQRAAIATALTFHGSTQHSSDQSPQLRMLQLNCYACHTRDKLGGVGRFRKAYFETVGHVDIGDEGRLPPPLTGVGSKLTAAAMKNVFAGKGAVRPHMHGRMPLFPPAQTKSLPSQLVAADNGQQQPNERAVFDNRNLNQLTAAGRALMDSGCVQCHSFKGDALPGTVGVDLNGIVARVNPKWFHDFLLNPAALKTRTRMPTFFPNGQSQNKDILAGNTEEQIAAMWAYLKDLNRQELPEKIVKARAQDYELTPTERPIVLRTFMNNAGTHAIAVGFPQKVHYAFDAESLSLTEAWRGRFVDAEGTWFVRFAPPAEPLGEKVIQLSDGIALAELETSRTAWPVTAESAGAFFGGYRLDESGVPTLLYRVGGVAVEDRIEPHDAQGLKRTLQLSLINDANTPATLWLRALTGTSLTKVSTDSFRNNDGLTVGVAIGTESVSGQTRHSNGFAEWLVPIKVEKQSTIEVRYEW